MNLSNCVFLNYDIFVDWSATFVFDVVVRLGTAAVFALSDVDLVVWELFLSDKLSVPNVVVRLWLTVVSDVDVDSCVLSVVLLALISGQWSAFIP